MVITALVNDHSTELDEHELAQLLNTTYRTECIQAAVTCNSWRHFHYPLIITAPVSWEAPGTAGLSGASFSFTSFSAILQEAFASAVSRARRSPCVPPSSFIESQGSVSQRKLMKRKYVLRCCQ